VTNSITASLLRVTNSISTSLAIKGGCKGDDVYVADFALTRNESNAKRDYESNLTGVSALHNANKIALRHLHQSASRLQIA